MFLVENMSKSKCKFQAGTAGVQRRYLQLKLVTHSFYGGDTINSQLLSDLPDMYINRSITNDYIITPNLVEDFVSEKNTARFEGQ